jgi:hypothetical protein
MPLHPTEVTFKCIDPKNGFSPAEIITILETLREKNLRRHVKYITGFRSQITKIIVKESIYVHPADGSCDAEAQDEAA